MLLKIKKNENNKTPSPIPHFDGFSWQTNCFFVVIILLLMAFSLYLGYFLICNKNKCAFYSSEKKIIINDIIERE
jgi:hypothetical protein